MTALLICRNIVNLSTSSIVFCMVMTCFVINRDGASYLTILKYATKTYKVEMSWLGLIESLIAFKNIWSAKSGLILGISIVIIE